jgi:hypothetical protein
MRKAMNRDCQAFAEAASYVENWLILQPAVKEESLTDWLLFDISSKLPNVHYLAFSRHVEARKTGADWEWWFVFRSGSYRYRIQAKKANSTGDNYPSIAYTNRYGLQIDKLISDAKSANAIPAYIIFTAANAPSKSKCGGMVRPTGAFSVGAQEAYTQFIAPGKTTIDETRLLSHSIPMQCFACCPYMSCVDRMDDFIDAYFQPEAEILSQSNDNLRPGYHRELPSYATALLNHRDGSPTWIEREFEQQLPDINSLIVYDLREST